MPETDVNSEDVLQQTNLLIQALEVPQEHLLAREKSEEETLGNLTQLSETNHVVYLGREDVSNPLLQACNISHRLQDRKDSYSGPKKGIKEFC